MSIQSLLDFKFSLGLGTIHGCPIQDALLHEAPTSREMVLDVVESFCSGFQSFLFEVDELVAEPTPEPNLTIATHTTTIHPILDELNIRNDMFLLQVISERLVVVAHLSAYTSKFFLVAAPLFQVEMLGIFMSLPIILGVKRLINSRKCSRKVFYLD